MAIALAMLVLLLSPVLPSALAQPKEGVAGNRVDTLLRAFPNGLTPEQADALLGVMDEAELRSALRPRLLASPEGARPFPSEAAPLAAPLAAYAHRIDAVAAAFPQVPGAI